MGNFVSTVLEASDYLVLGKSRCNLVYNSLGCLRVNSFCLSRTITETDGSRESLKRYLIDWQWADKPAVAVKREMDSCKVFIAELVLPLKTANTEFSFKEWNYFSICNIISIISWLVIWCSLSFWHFHLITCFVLRQFCSNWGSDFIIITHMSKNPNEAQSIMNFSFAL